MVRFFMGLKNFLSRYQLIEVFGIKIEAALPGDGGPFIKVEFGELSRITQR